MSNSCTRLLATIAAACISSCLQGCGDAPKPSPSPPPPGPGPAPGPAPVPPAPTVEIAPGVHMPTMNYGDVNTTLWLRLGGRGMDTALCYPKENQAAVSQAVKAKAVDRSELFVATKVPCCPSDVYSYSTLKCKGLRNYTHTEENIDEALGNLGIGAADLLVMHWPCNDFEGTVAAYKMMEAALAKGKIRAIGVSNFNASLLSALSKRATIKPAVNQNAYSVGNHRNASVGSDDDTLDYCLKNNVTLSAWAPLGHTSGHGSSIFGNPVVKAIAEAHNRSVAQVALRWDLQQGILPVTAGSNPAHLRQDLQVFDFELDKDQMEALAAIGGDEKPLMVV